MRRSQTTGWFETIHPTAKTAATPRARVSVRRSTYRGKPGWTISGKDQLGRSVRMFSDNEIEARRMAGEIRRGEEPMFDFQRKELDAQPGPYKAWADTVYLDGKPVCLVLRGNVNAAELLAAALNGAEQLSEFTKKLVDTADGLAAWVYCERTGRRSKIEVHPSHAANRLRKMAREIAGGGK